MRVLGSTQYNSCLTTLKKIHLSSFRPSFFSFLVWEEVAPSCAHPLGFNLIRFHKLVLNLSFRFIFSSLCVYNVLIIFQIANFLYSVPQLFHLVPCPRHRLPKYIKGGFQLPALYPSSSFFMNASDAVFCRISGYFIQQ